ncbi:MAG: Arylsulfatase [Gemmatimonadaceae bacterium]|nr:Arylsulfatase [Gemmatimonadaceae bacterium]
MIRLLGLLLAIQAAGGRPAARPVTASVEAKPNIVVLLADDLGYADLGVQGAADISTPHIDRLFREGVRFTDGYMSASLCSPSRAGLLTGRYQQRFGHDFNPGEAGTDSAGLSLPADMPTLAHFLRSSGYATGLIGKWHLGSGSGARPLDKGFDEFYGFLGREHWYTRNRFTQEFEPLWRDRTEVKDTAYLTRQFAREAVSFIERHAKRPFFLYVPFNAVHVPMQPDPATDGRVARISNPRRRQYSSMLLSMDDAVGEILAALDRLKLTTQTIVVFASDNGGPTEMTTARNAPFRGAKGTLYEGGIRVPFAMRWPARLAAGTVYRHPITALDIAPTALAAAGDTARRAFDGVNLIPFLTGQRGDAPPHARLFWRMGFKYAVREGNWKLLATNFPRKAQLFDLTTDPAESRSVRWDHAAKATEMERAYAEWNRGMRRPNGLLPGYLGMIQQWLRVKYAD